MPTCRTIVFLLLISCLSLTGCGGGANPANPASPLVGITVSPDTTVTTNEYGQTTTVSISLGSIPAADVTVPVSSTDTSEGTVDKTSLVFTRTDWSTPQTITVTGVNDTGADGDQSYSIRLGPAISAPSSSYNSMEKLIPAVNLDVTDGSFVVSAISGNTSESGTTATFTVRLGSAPIANVTIPVESSNTAEGTVNPISLLFTPSDWNQDQTVTVTGVGDVYADGGVAFDIQLDPVSSTDPKYSGLDPADVPVINDSVKRGAVTVSPISSYTDESGKTATFTVHLNMAPAANVTIEVNSSDLSKGTVDTSLLTFTSANYGDQTVTVTGVDDNIADGNQGYTITLGTAKCQDLSGNVLDDNFEGLDPADVSVINVDLVDPYGVTPRISAGNYHNLVLAGDGTVWGWGACSSGQLDMAPITCPGGSGSTLPQRLNINKASAVSAGDSFSVIVKADGSVWTSGINEPDASQLGHAGGGAGAPLAQVDGITNVTTVSAGGRHTLALTDDGSVWAWGLGVSGQLGNNSNTFSQTPVLTTFPGGITAKAIAAGSTHSLAIGSDNNVYSWGADGNSQLGLNTISVEKLTPTLIPSLTDVTTIGAGQVQSFAVGIYNFVADTYGWGLNSDLQLGTTVPGTPKAIPTGVSFFDGTTIPSQIDGSYWHTLGLFGNSVYAWGDNDGGENPTESQNNRGALGMTAAPTSNPINPVDKTTPTLSKFSTTAIEVNAGNQHSLVLLSNGRLQTSGNNSVNQLGTNLNQDVISGVTGAPAESYNHTDIPVYVEDPGDDGTGSVIPFYAYRPILSGQPATSSPGTTASISVCWNTVANAALPSCGPITQYKYKTDTTAWSVPIATNTPITLNSADLIPGETVTLWVKGMIGATEMQTDTSAVKVSWTVD